ncbi:MAG TPA: nicotinate-nucleotide adenylyltransferase [Pyrinomonadaceae bacterium]|nr:nicotinate-nucleotide adenylyltransferase [Pyrinomonadaceae bacterium]
MPVLQKMEQPKRIAIYGGTFDPVHSGHLEISRRVTQFFGIDEFLFMPARVAPHKLDREVLSALHRYAMLALATGADSRLCVSTFELDGPGRQYTVDTLYHFRSRFGEAAELFFVMGADSWAEITTWREWRRLMTLANLIVVTRPGYEISAAAATAETAASVVDLRGEREVSGASEPGSRKIFVTDAVMIDVSATEIRRAASEDDDEKLTRLVPLEVAEYIRKYRLYRNTDV